MKHGILVCYGKKAYKNIGDYIQSVAAAQYEQEKVIYTPEDKAKYLMANNQEVIDIISDLGLDLK